MARLPFGRVLKVGALGVALTAVVLATTSRGATTFNDLAVPQLVKTSGEPGGIAIDGATHRAYVSDTRENTLYVFDLQSGATLAHIATGLQPYQVLLSGGRAFVSNFADHTVTVVDTGTSHAVKTLVVGGLGLAVDAATHRLFAAEAKQISVVDLATDRRALTIEVPSGANIWGLAFDASNNRLYATDIANPRVLVFDAGSGALLRSVAIAAPARLGIAVGEPGQILVTTYTDQDPQLVVIDAASGAVRAQRAVAAFSNAVVREPSSGLVYTTSAKDRSVMSADTGVRATLAKAKLADVPGAIAIDPQRGPIVVSAGGSAPPARTLPEVVPVVRP